MQTLYEWDFNGRSNNAVPGILEKNLREFGPGLDDKEFPTRLIYGVIEKINDLDTIIEKAAPEWPIAQIAIVDRNILRLGLYELLFGDYAAVPPKVAINEAIELAKSFGGESSGKFVNGVLGTVYRELGEPDKNHPRRGEDSSLKKEECVGAVVFRRDGAAILWAMIHDVFNYWTFVKGHPHGEESPEDAVLREVKEEVGITAHLIGVLGENSYPATNEQGEHVLRRVTYYLVESNEFTLKAEQNAGITDARWFPMEDVKATKHYEDTNHIIEAAVAKINNLTS